MPAQEHSPELSAALDKAAARAGSILAAEAGPGNSTEQLRGEAAKLETAARAQPGTPVQATQTCPSSEPIPAHVLHAITYVEIHDGEPPPGVLGGEAFGNHEGKLPGGSYVQYDVHPFIADQERGPERIVVDHGANTIFYTADHGQSYTKV